MKRSPLKRKPPTAAQRKLAGVRAAYRRSFGKCMLCPETRNLACHEIARGASRHRAVKEPCCWLVLCIECHREMDSYAEWPLTRQLAAKMIHDFERYDLELFNQIRGRAEGAIAQEEVSAWIEATGAKT